MAVRQIEYTVKADGLSPSVKQFGGVQGDHRATEVIFNISNELYNALSQQAASGGRLIYRFDGYDGEGGMCRSVPKDLPEKQVVYPLEEWITRYGGIVRVVLVISLSKDDLTEMELYSFPAILQLKNLPSGDNVSGESYESMSVLAQVAKDSADIAVEAKDTAVTAQKKTEEAKAVLEGDTVWIFNGGDASGEVGIDLIIDGEMSDKSTNPVQNKVAKAYTDKASAESEKILKQYVDDKYPVGSIWIGGKYEEAVYDLDTEELIHAADEPINPVDIFGGEWELIDKTFAPYRKWITDSEEMGNLISSGDDLSVNAIGITRFENEIKLSINGKFNVDISPDSNNSILFQIPESSLNNWGIQYIANNGSIIHPVYHFAYSDDANSIIAFQASDAGGGNIRFTAVEQAPQNNNGIIKSGSSFHMTVSLNFMHYYLLDSYCNKFYWRRIEPTEVTE